MSRIRLLRRLERLTAQVEALESVIDTRGLEALSDEELDALWLELGGEPNPVPVYRVVTSRGVEEAVPEELLPSSSESEEPEEAPEPAPPPLGSDETEERLGETRREPRIRRSTDLPESRAEERARLFELDTVRLAEPGDVPGSGFRWLPPRPRRRRSRRF